MKHKLPFLALVFINFMFGQTNVSDKVSESFNSTHRERLDSIAKSLHFKGGDKIKVLTIFTIDTNGNVTDIKSRSVHPIFEEEAIRVLRQLPKMTPTKQNGKTVSRKYALPIVFEIETERAKAQRLKKEKRKRKRDLKKETTNSAN